MPTPRRRAATTKRNGRTRADRMIDAQRALNPRDYPTITKAEADRIRRAYEATDEARKVFDPKRYQRGGGYSPADMQKIADLAGVASPSNAERGALELYEFMHDPPTVKFPCYVGTYFSGAGNYARVRLAKG